MNQKSICLLFILSLIACKSNPVDQYETYQKPIDNCIIISNVNVYTGSEYIEKSNLIFNENQILSIGNDTARYRFVQRIDGTGKTIIPPLINGHVHIWFPDNLKQSLKAGVFANLDMHTTDYFASNLRTFNDSLHYSKYFSSNSGATVTGGHGTQFGIEVPTINDTIDGAQFVIDRVNAKADYIKILKEPSMNMITEVATSQVINKAHELNKKAVAHVSKLKQVEELIEQGVDGFVHVWYDKPASKESLMKMKESSIFLMPTLAVTQKLFEYERPNPFIADDADFNNVLKEVNKAYENGVDILCGTDAPNFGFNYTDKLFDEMLLLKEAGLSNEAVIKSATVNIYNAFELSEFSELGRGSKADFILIHGNPITKLADIKRTKQVFKNGIKIN